MKGAEKMDTVGQIEVEARNGYTWVTLPAGLTNDNYQHIERQIEARLEGKPNRVVLDLIFFNYMYSTGISLILRLNKRILDSGGMLWLVNVSERCRDYLTAVHLDKVLPFFPTDLEFEVTKDDIREKMASNGSFGFVCATIVEKGVCHITLSGSMTANNNLTPQGNATYKKGISRYAFDLTGLDVIDSRGVCVLRDMISAVKENNSQCVAYGSNRVLFKLLKLFSVDKIIALFDTKRKALNAMVKEGDDIV